MVREWKIFKGEPTPRRRDRLRVTINPRGVILVNRKAFEVMGRPEAVLLMYDERHQAIGLQPASAGEQYAFPLKSKDKVTHRTIYAWPFCKFFKLKPPKTVSFTSPELDHNGVLMLHLNHATEVGRGEG